MQPRSILNPILFVQAIAVNAYTTNFTRSLKTAGLWQALNDSSAEYTVFAPNDEVSGCQTR